MSCTYLNPVDAVVQLRPSMRHLNKQSNNIEGSSNQEEWIPLNYHGKDSEESFRCMEKMMAAREGSEIQFTMSRSDYLDSLCGITRPNIFSVVTTAASLPREDPWEVPREVGYEIMRRLPLEDLGKFKTVSKSWKWHISNPEFIRILLQNNKNRKLILASRPKYNSKPTALFSLGVNESKAKAMFKKPKTKLDVVGTCIGLILAQDCIDKDLLHLMNPVMQQMYRVPYTTIAPEIPERGRGMWCMYGFGHDSLTDTYKVVSLVNWPTSAFKEENPLLVSVCNLKTGSVRLVQNPYANIAPKWPTNGVLVNQNLHWAIVKRDPKLLTVVAFSLQTEELTEIKLPEAPADTSFLAQLCSLGGKLAAVLKADNGDMFASNIWFMEEYGVHTSWTKIAPALHLESNLICSQEADKVGEILFFGGENELYTYDIRGGGEGVRSDVKIDGCSPEFDVFQGTYVDSLVSAKLSDAWDDD